jgi:hypothetical protein
MPIASEVQLQVSESRAIFTTPHFRARTAKNSERTANLSLYF